jgi:hypothetical protein
MRNRFSISMGSWVGAISGIATARALKTFLIAETLDFITSSFILHPSSFILHPSSFFPLPSSFFLHPSSFILHPSSFILHPSSFILHPSSFILLPSSLFLLPSSFFLLPSSFILLPSSFNICYKWRVKRDRGSIRVAKPDKVATGVGAVPLCLPPRVPKTLRLFFLRT